MSTQEYQLVNQYNNYQYPESLKNEFHKLIDLAEYSGLKTPSAIKVYNILCGIEALLCRYETISQETLLAIEMIEDYDQCLHYLSELHQNAIHQKVYNSKMMTSDIYDIT